VYASWARGFRFPNFDEASGFFGSSPMLEPETSRTWEVGLKARSDCASLNLALYTMNVEDEILFNPFAPNPITGFNGLNVNVDRVRHRGVEVSGTLRPVEWLELFGTYTYDDVKFTRDTLTGFEGNRLPLVPEHRGSAGVRLLLPYGFEASLNGRYVGSRPVANDLGNTAEELPKFATYDARVAWSGDLTEWLALTVEVNGYNLTNREDTEFFVTGTVRARDVTSQNTVESTQLANAKVQIKGKGPLWNNQRRGWFTKILDWFSPF